MLRKTITFFYSCIDIFDSAVVGNVENIGIAIGEEFGNIFRVFFDVGVQVERKNVSWS